MLLLHLAHPLHDSLNILWQEQLVASTILDGNVSAGFMLIIFKSSPPPIAS